MEDIITLRASFLIDRALTGLSMDFDKAVSLVRNFNTDLTEREKRERVIVLAAIDNLIDFAVAQETAMLNDINENADISRAEDCERVFERYNLHYAEQEDSQVAYASMMAAWWLMVPDDNLITFMTQGDERVRAWHLSYEGLSYRKADFPPELIPPIEWGCRCYLVTDNAGLVRSEIMPTQRNIQCNPIFSESLAKGGRIFTGEHPYFNVKLPPEAVGIRNILKSRFGL